MCGCGWLCVQEERGLVEEQMQQEQVRSSRCTRGRWRACVFAGVLEMDTVLSHCQLLLPYGAGMDAGLH